MAPLMMGLTIMLMLMLPLAMYWSLLRRASWTLLLSGTSDDDDSGGNHVNEDDDDAMESSENSILNPFVILRHSSTSCELCIPLRGICKILGLSPFGIYLQGYIHYSVWQYSDVLMLLMHSIHLYICVCTHICSVLIWVQLQPMCSFLAWASAHGGFWPF